MGNKYQFPVQKCGKCGLSLSGKNAELAGMKGDEIPMGRCPKCGSAYRLVEVEPKPAKPSKAEAEEAAPEE